MRLTGLNAQDVLASAKQMFPGKYIELTTCDLFLADIEADEIQIEGIDHPLYVSTHYAYENRIVNGNPTRYKVELTAIYVKDNRYDVIYDSTQSYYIAYEEQGIQFVRYDKLQDYLKPYIKKQDS